MKLWNIDHFPDFVLHIEGKGALTFKIHLCWDFYVKFQNSISDPNSEIGLTGDSLGRPPKFSQETQVAPQHYLRKTGETFSVTCEADGHPQPEIIWLKNGKRMKSDHVDYVHSGKSNVNLVVLDSSDAGLYSCMWVFSRAFLKLPNFFKTKYCFRSRHKCLIIRVQTLKNCF